MWFNVTIWCDDAAVLHYTRTQNPQNILIRISNCAVRYPYSTVPSSINLIKLFRYLEDSEIMNSDSVVRTLSHTHTQWTSPTQVRNKVIHIIIIALKLRVQRSFGEPQLIDEATECRTQVDFRFHFQSKFECALNFVSLHGNQLIAGLHLQSACGRWCTAHFGWIISNGISFNYIFLFSGHMTNARLDTVLARAKSLDAKAYKNHVHCWNWYLPNPIAFAFCCIVSVRIAHAKCNRIQNVVENVLI